MGSNQALQFMRTVCAYAGVLLVFGAIVRYAGVTIAWLPGGSSEIAWLSIAASIAGGGSFGQNR